MTLRSALGCSAAFHVALLIAHSPLGWLPIGEGVHPLEVSYLPVQIPEPAVAKKPAPKIQQGSDPVRVLADTPEGGQTPSGLKVVAEAPPPSRLVQRPRIRPAVHHWTEVAPLPLPKVSSMTKEEFAFVEHKERVRRHLKARLHYPSFLCAEARGGASSSAGLSDGTVRIRLFLNAQGDLHQAVVLEASDPRLSAIAIRDARGAAPYPRFPGVHHPRQLRYEFLVRYKPE